MPQIIVTSDPAGENQGGAVMLQERINADDFESAHFRKQLIERLGWAVGDAHLVQVAPARPQAASASGERAWSPGLAGSHVT